MSVEAWTVGLGVGGVALLLLILCYCSSYGEPGVACGDVFRCLTCGRCCPRRPPPLTPEDEGRIQRQQIYDELRTQRRQFPVDPDSGDDDVLIDPPLPDLSKLAPKPAPPDEDLRREYSQPLFV